MATRKSQLVEPLHETPAGFARGIDDQEHHHTCTASGISPSRLLLFAKPGRIIHRNDITDPRLIPLHLSPTDYERRPGAGFERAIEAFSNVSHQPSLWDRCWCTLAACIPWGLELHLHEPAAVSFSLSFVINNHQLRATIGPKLITPLLKNGRTRI